MLADAHKYTALTPLGATLRALKALDLGVFCDSGEYDPVIVEACGQFECMPTLTTFIPGGDSRWFVGVAAIKNSGSHHGLWIAATMPHLFPFSSLVVPIGIFNGKT